MTEFGEVGIIEGKLSIGKRGGGGGIEKLTAGAKEYPRAKEYPGAKEYPPPVAFVEGGQCVTTGVDILCELTLNGPFLIVVVNPSEYLE